MGILQIEENLITVADRHALESFSANLEAAELSCRWTGAGAGQPDRRLESFRRWRTDGGGGFLGGSRASRSG
jgi:hypothetical protein